MADLDPKAVKSMLGALQRQRNAALDRVVDLETAFDAKLDQLTEAATTIQDQANTINNTRDMNTQLTAQVNQLTDHVTQLSNVLAQAANLPAGFTIVLEAGNYVVVPPIVGNAVKLDVRVEESTVKDAPKSDFEPATVITGEKKSAVK